MAKKTTKKVSKKSANKETGFLDDFAKSIKKSGALVLDEDMGSMIPWQVPFNHLGLQKITGGLLGGKVMGIEGASQAGKSWLLYELFGNTIKMGGVSYLVDAERAFEPAYARASGVDLKARRLLYSDNNVIEDIEEAIIEFVKRSRDNIKDINIPITAGLDSLVNTKCREQAEAEIKGKDLGYAYMKRADAVYSMVDRLIPILDDYGASLVLINQLRIDKSAGLFKDPTYTQFENLIYRYTQLIRGKLSTVEKEEGDKQIKLGQHVRWESFKSRFVKPKQFVKAKYEYEKGLFRYSGLFDLLIRDKAIIGEKRNDPNDGRKKIQGCRVVGDEEKRFWPLAEAKEMFEQYPHLLEPKYIEIHENEDELSEFNNSENKREEDGTSLDV